MKMKKLEKIKLRHTSGIPDEDLVMVYGVINEIIDTLNLLTSSDKKNNSKDVKVSKKVGKK